MGYKTMEWVNEEEAAQIGELLRLKQAKYIFNVFFNLAKEAEQRDSVDAPSCPYMLQPDFQGF